MSSPQRLRPVISTQSSFSSSASLSPSMSYHDSFHNEASKSNSRGTLFRRNKLIYVLGVASAAFLISYVIIYLSFEKHLERNFHYAFPKNFKLSLVESTKRWLNAIDTAMIYVDVGTETDENGFMYRGIQNILNNESALSLFNPFNLAIGVNVWDLFPPLVSCPDVRRLGRLGDGGKWLCGMSILSMLRQRECIVYSFGISTDASFEEEILTKTNCKVYAFDPSIGSLPNPSHVNKSQWEVLQRERIVFHKLALSSRSGATAYHMFTAHLHDIMNGYGHSYLDILKVDIEGAEWNLFEDLTSDRQSVPVGQILIELHYESMSKIKRFFNGLKFAGFYAYSREINLQPCLAGGKPVAVEYSFINPQNVLALSADATDPFPSKDAFKFPVPARKSHEWHEQVRGLIYVLTQKVRFDYLKYTLSELYDKVYRFYDQYPVLVFHDDLDVNDESLLMAEIPKMNLRFIRVNFSVPNHLNVSTVPHRTRCAPTSSTLGYRHMCRFHSFQVHDIIFSMPEFDSVEYLMRVDDDSLFTSIVGYDLFKFMKINRKFYGFVNIVADSPPCVYGLWNASRDFITHYQLRSHNFNSSQGFFGEWKEPNVFYNNFEISHVSLWKNPVWIEYVSYIDRIGGIYTHRWGDAPIHTIGVSLMISKNQIHSFSDIGYRHYPFVDQKPSGLPIPTADPFIPAHRQDCKYYSHWVCNQVYNASMNITESSFLGDDLVLSPSSLKSVIYTFAHRGREYLLIETLHSFYRNYIREHPVPVIVFYNKAVPVNVTFIESFTSDLLSAISPEGKSLLSFIGVRLKSVSPPLDPDCGFSDPERLSASHFLTFDVFDVLHTRLGYEWLLRIADDAILKSRVSYDLFRQMHNQRKLYGFITAVREHGKCVLPLWKRLLKRCQESAQGCSGLINQWPEQVLIYNNFEISHFSVWQSESCQHVMDISRGESSRLNERSRRYFDERVVSIQQLNTSASQYHVSDALIHTLCMISSLEPSQIQRFEDVDYKGYLAPSMSEDAWRIIHSPTNRSHPSHRVLQSLKGYNENFMPRKFGWLGGDVSASIALPPQSSKDAIPSKYIWVFGDSLIGSSSATRRTEGSLIANSVAVVHLHEPMSSVNLDDGDFRKIEKIHYFWDSDVNGSPAAIFRPRLSSDSTIEARQVHTDNDTLFWPLGGISVRLHESNGTNRAFIDSLLIVGQFVSSVAKREGTHAGSNKQERNVLRSLSFRELASTLISVSNPYDPPNMWTYTHALFPFSKKGTFNWFASASLNGRAYAEGPSKSLGNQRESNDWVVFLGSFVPKENDDSKQAVQPKSLEFDPQALVEEVFLSMDSSFQVVSRISVSSISSLAMEDVEILLNCSFSSTPVWRPFSAIDASSECQPHILFRSVVRLSEGSLFFDEERRLWNVISLQVPESYVQWCYATRIEGPWTCDRTINLPEPWYNDGRYLVYGAKAHPELLSSNRRRNYRRAVISFISNAKDGFFDLFTESNYDIYTPKFFDVRF